MSTVARPNNRGYVGPTMVGVCDPFVADAASIEGAPTDRRSGSFLASG
jgi:hypothetical protein